MTQLTGYRSPGRRAARDKLNAMAIPSMQQRSMPDALKEDKEFYLLFLESKKYEGRRDRLGKRKFNEAISKMRARWATLTEG